MIIKVCGITTLEDALLSVKLGANALGFNFYRKSPRYICPGQAAQIIARLPREILAVGVVVGRPGEAEMSCTPALQLHGLRSEEELADIPNRVFVAVSPEETNLFRAREIIVDGSWGTGKKADWESLLGLSRPYILSGGLTPENVGEAIMKLRPYGVDVCSGVESSPGRKDPDKLRIFLGEVQRVNV